MRFRRPTILTAILGLICLATLLALGTWQLDRREWKRELLATIEERLTSPAVPIPAADGPEWEYRRVTVAGEVVPDSWFRFPGRAKDGQVGDALMLLVQEPSGRLILVEHDFVAFGAPLPELPSAIAKEGILRAPPTPGLFTPDNNASANQWYFADPSAMAALKGRGSDPVYPLYVVGEDWRPQLSNRHLEYAVTWFSFAGIFVIIFALFHRRKA